MRAVSQRESLSGDMKTGMVWENHPRFIYFTDLE